MNLSVWTELKNIITKDAFGAHKPILEKVLGKMTELETKCGRCGCGGCAPSRHCSTCEECMAGKVDYFSEKKEDCWEVIM